MRDAPDAYDRLEQAAENVATRAEWERANRVGLLWVHAVVGFVAGLQMLLYGSASTIEASVGVWSRAALGGMGVLGGVLLAGGIVRGRSVVLEALGLAVIGLWDALMAVGFIVARVRAGQFSPRNLLEPIPDGYVLPYPISIYLGLAALIAVHLWTLRRFVRSGRR